MKRVHASTESVNGKDAKSKRTDSEFKLQLQEYDSKYSDTSDSDSDSSISSSTSISHTSSSSSSSSGSSESDMCPLNGISPRKLKRPDYSKEYTKMCIQPESGTNWHATDPITSVKQNSAETDDNFLDLLETEVKSMTSHTSPSELDKGEMQVQPEQSHSVWSGASSPSLIIDEGLRMSKPQVQDANVESSQSDGLRKEEEPTPSQNGNNNTTQKKSDWILYSSLSQPDKKTFTQPKVFTYEEKAEMAKHVVDALMPYFRNRTIQSDEEFKWLAKKLTLKGLNEALVRGKTPVSEYVGRTFKKAGVATPKSIWAVDESN